LLLNSIRVPDPLQVIMAQVAFACACLSQTKNDNAAQWVAWALSARQQPHANRRL